MGDLQTTTGNQLSTLDSRILSATDLLQPASEDAIASAVLKLGRSGLPYPPGLDPANAARVYIFALRGVSREAIKRTVQKIVQGDVPTALNFIPTPPALASLCKAEAREMWADRERLIVTRESIVGDRERAPKTDEEKARVAAMVAQVKANADALRDEVKDAFYNKPEDELNRIFRNKVDLPAEQGPAKFDDDDWHRRNSEMEQKDGSTTDTKGGAT